MAFNNIQKGAPSAEDRKLETKQIAESLPANLRILELYVENIKRVKVCHIVPKHPVVIVSGRNEQGKTSVLDAILWALTGTSEIPTQPIREGQQTGTIKMNVGDEFVVTRHFARTDPAKSKDGSHYFTKLTIEGRNRQQFSSPQLLLNAILGRISFDPLAFARMDRKAQLETLSQMVKFDLDLDVLDAEQKRDYDLRRDAGRDVDQIKARLGTMTPPAADLPTAPVDLAALTAQLRQAANANSRAQQAEALKNNFEERAQMAAVDANRKRTEAIALLSQAEQLDGYKATVKLASKANPNNVQSARLADAANVEIPDRVDFQAVAQALEEGQRTNAAIQKAIEYGATKTQLEMAEAIWKETDDRMRHRAARRAQVIADAKMPVEGLSIEAGEVMWNGLPFTQASGATRIRVSVLLAMSSNPKLRVMQIRDGSLLDDDGLLAIADLAEQHNYQVLIERVDSSGKVGVVMEDGTASGEEVVQG